MNAKIIFHQDLGKICHFSDVNLVDEDIEKALEDSLKEFQPKTSSQIGILDFSPLHSAWLGCKNLKSWFHWIFLAEILVR